MDPRTRRLGGLLDVQRRLLSVHEARRAGHLVAAERAMAEAADLKARADGESSFSSVFPDLYSKRIEAALNRAAIARGQAAEEAGRVAAATLRTRRVEEAFRAALSVDERREQERETLEAMEIRLARQP